MISTERDTHERRAKQIFGIERFYSTQWRVIKKIFEGERVLLVERTGFGKSLCYQYPALMMEGVTIVFSPLISLMRDQCAALVARNVAAGCVCSEQSEEENAGLLQAAIDGTLKLLYIAPERMENAQWVEAMARIKVAMVVIDEAHCISVWGHDFRPSYRKIVDLVKILPPTIPVLATTATATPRVQSDIMGQIGEHVSCMRGRLMRDNLLLNVITVESEDEKMMWLAENLPSLDGTGLVYCGTQVATEVYSRWLIHVGVDSLMYNAGLPSDRRREVEKALRDDKCKCVVSTNALGMGIDKPNIRFIIHTQIPASPIHYYQEIGRAGRDGEPAQVILFFNPKTDLNLPRSFIESAKPSGQTYAKVLKLIMGEPTSVMNLGMKANIKQGVAATIVEDLVEMGLVRQVVQGKSKYYEHNDAAPALDMASIEEQRRIKFSELDRIAEYATSDGCRMKFLCEYLGDVGVATCGRCDNDRGCRRAVQTSDLIRNRLRDFKNYWLSPRLSLRTASSALGDGVAAVYANFSEVGSVVRKSLVNHVAFPGAITDLMVSVFDRYLSDERYDYVMAIPKRTGDDGCTSNMSDLAHDVGERLGIAYCDVLRCKRPINPQSDYDNGRLKMRNVRDAFYCQEPNQVRDRAILLIDAACDSGHTIKEVGRVLTRCGARVVVPLVMAKITGGAEVGA